jgi:translation initiation factor IF-2
VHTKRRNKLDAQLASDIVFVQFNARLLSQKERSKTKNVDVLLYNVVSKSQDWLVEGCDGIDEENEENEDMQLCKSSRVRELHEDDLESNSECEGIEIEDEDVEF